MMDVELHQRLGARLRELRDKAGLSQEALGPWNQICSKQTVANTESAVHFKLGTWEKLVKAVGGNPYEILNEETAALRRSQMQVVEGGRGKQTTKAKRAAKSAGKSSSARGTPDLLKLSSDPQPLRSKFSIPPVTEVALAGNNA